MKCLECGNETPGVDHNRRGPRCTFCWSPLPPTAVAKEPEPVVERLEEPEADETEVTVTPAAQKLLAEYQLDPRDVAEALGKARLTKRDVERHLRESS